MKITIALILLPFCAAATLAGYLNVSASGSSTPRESADSTRWNAVVERADQSQSFPRNLGGRFETVSVDALEAVEVTITHPNLAAGDSVFAYTVNGGRINGKLTDTLTTSEEGSIRFTFQAGRYFGDYAVVLRFGGREQVLTFWVGKARLGEEAP